MKKYLILTILIINLSYVLIAQNRLAVIDNLTYSSNYDTGYDDRTGISIKEIENGFITLAETFYGKGIIAKHDYDGKIIWEKHFNNERINNISVYDNYIYAIGYEYLKRKAWISKIDSDGSIVWEKLIRFQFENEAEAISISENGDIFIICEIQRAWLPIKIRLKKSMYKRISFRSLQKDILENQIGIVKIDTAGRSKWKKTLGRQKNYNHYYAGTLSANNSEFVAQLYFTEYKKEQKNQGTRLIVLDKNGKIKKTINNQNQMSEVIKQEDNEFLTFENNHNNRLDTPDTITISKIIENKLVPQKKYISNFNTFTITSQLTDAQNSFYLGGYVCNFKTLGTIWSHHNDIYIAKFDSEFNLQKEYQFNQESIDQINDMIMIENRIYAIGESWYKENDKIKIRMRLIILK